MKLNSIIDDIFFYAFPACCFLIILFYFPFFLQFFKPRDIINNDYAAFTN